MTQSDTHPVEEPPEEVPEEPFEETPREAPGESVPEPPRNGYGITGLVLAVTGVVLGLLPATRFIALFVGAPAVLFGLLGVFGARRKTITSRAVSWSGTGLGVVSVVLGVVGVLGLVQAVGEYADRMARAARFELGVSAAAPNPNEARPVNKVVLGESWVSEKVTITVSKPAPFEPGRYSAAPESAGRTVAMTVTVENTGDEPIPPHTLFAFTTVDGKRADPVLAVLQGVTMVPMADVLPGRTATWKIGYAVPEAPADLVVRIPGFELRDTVYFVGHT